MEKPPTCDNENYSLSRCVDLQKAASCWHHVSHECDALIWAPSCSFVTWHMHMTHAFYRHTAKERSVDCKSYRVNKSTDHYCAQASNTSVTSRLGRARAVFRLTLINRPKAIVGLPSVFFSSRWDPRLGRTAKFVHTKEQMRSTISSVSEILPALRQYLPQSHSESAQVNARNKLPRANNAQYR